MSPELIAFVIEKIKVPNSIKTGLILSVIVFKGLGIENRMKQKMQPTRVS